MGPHILSLFKPKHPYQAKDPNLFKSNYKYHKFNHKHYSQPMPDLDRVVLKCPLIYMVGSVLILIVSPRLYPKNLTGRCHLDFLIPYKYQRFIKICLHRSSQMSS